MTALSESTWPACNSALRLDRLLMGELAAAEADALRAHLESCEKCAGATRALEADRASAALPPFRAELPPLRAERAAQAVPLRPRRSLRFAAAAGILAAASIAIALRPRPPSEHIKGSPFALGMYVQHGGEVRAAAPGETVAPGDSVRFAATAPRDSFVAVLSLDARGAASIYYPQAERAAPLSAGREVLLPAGTRLDDSVGREQIVGLFCSSAVELEPLRRALADDRFVPPEGCQVTRWSFDKR